MPFEISTESQFSAAHRIEGYEGNCSRLHGHNWRVRVTVRAGEAQEGMAYDFRKLKANLNEVLAILDHVVLNDLDEFRSVSPTAEMIAKWVYERLDEKLKGESVRIKKVEVWESPHNSASYFRG